MPIVTEGLIGYWNSKQGVNGSVWENIAPATQGTINGTISGASLQIDGMYFDGVDDSVDFTTPLGLTVAYNFTIEAWVKLHTSPNVNNAIVSINNLSGMLLYSPNSYKYNTAPNKSSPNTFPPNTLNHIVVTKNNSNNSAEMYIDGNLVGEFTGLTGDTGFNSTSWAIGRRPANTSYFYKGHIPVVRFYDRLLTSTEITQNYAVSTEVGLSTSSPVSTPNVEIISVDRTKISDEAGVNQSIITVHFDSDVAQYVARLNGVDHTTGILVHTGGAVAANTDVQIIVDWNELTTEGSNRINVYGQNANGWTTMT